MNEGGMEGGREEGSKGVREGGILAGGVVLCCGDDCIVQ